MKRWKQLLKKRWLANAATGCVIVITYLLLSHIGVVFSSVGNGLRTFLGYFSPLFGGCVIAYLMDPLAELYQRTAFRRVKGDGARWTLSILLTIVTVLLFLAMMLLMLVPQLMDSVSTFIGNLGAYATSVQNWLESIGLNAANSAIDLDALIDSSENILDTVVDYISGNSDKIISVSATAGKGVFNWLIAFIMSIYLLSSKQVLKREAGRLLRALIPAARSGAVKSFLKRCDAILNRYVIFNLIDSLIVGVVNAVFMTVAGMQYTGLVSVMVAVMNLVPTFGPFVGGAIGGFILLMVRPMHALIFLIFTLLLQLVDGYILKPRLFGNSLGVSGLWVLVSVVVGGRMLGVTGILLSIPGAAILDQLYRESLLPRLERRREAKDRSAAGKTEEPAAGEDDEP